MTRNSLIQNILKNSKKDTEWKKEAEERLQTRNESKKSGSIATQLAIYMAEKGISQTALGKMTGVSPQQISKVLKGRENLTLATIEKIENALEIELIQVNILEEAEAMRFKENFLDELRKEAEKRFKAILTVEAHRDASFTSDLRLGKPRGSNQIEFSQLHMHGVSTYCKEECEVHFGSRTKNYEVFDESYPFPIAAEPNVEYSKFSLDDYE